MGNKKSKNKDGEIRIITDKAKNSEYTFLDDGLNKELVSQTSNQNDGVPRDPKDIQYNDNTHFLRRSADKFKNTDYLRFKANKRTKMQSKQNHPPVYE